MTKVLYYVYFAFLIHSLASECKDGVLRCNTVGDEKIPEICDFPRGYVLDLETKTCELRPVEGCEIASFDRNLMTCFLCKAGKIPDAENLKCVDVEGDKVVENCERYNPIPPNPCMFCKEDYFIALDKCMPIGEEKISNCEVYSAETVCQKCKNGYYLEVNKCVEIKSVENCKNHTLRQCVACENGYFFDVSLEAQLEVNSTLFEMIVGGEATKIGWSSFNNMRSVCTKEMVDNCIMHQAHNKCKTCMPNYFLNVDYQCERFPEDPIANCKRYTNGTTCMECEESYYLSANKCVERTKGENCEKVEVSEDKCKECVSSHFLKGDFTCSERVNKEIQNCETLAIDKDECLKCIAKNVATQDKLKCMAEIENCSNMVVGNNKEASSHTCSQCVDTHYLDQNQCKARTVDNCKTYEANKNKCTACEETHYLDSENNTCKLRDVANCTKYKANLNECVECKLNTHYLEAGDNCATVTKENCVEYTLNTDNCTKCKLGYYASNNACVKQNVSNCVKHVENENKCEECEFRFYINNGSCASQNLDHCVEYEESKNECKTCAFGYYLDSKTCHVVKKENCLAYTANTNDCVTCSPLYYLKEKECVATDVENCIKYEANSNTCSECAKSYVLNIGNNSCETPKLYCKTLDNQGICTECETGYYLNDSKDCVWQNLDNCLEYKANENVCTKCGSNYHVDQDICKKSAQVNCFKHVENSQNCEECNSGYYPDSGTCKAQEKENCLTFVPNTNTCINCAKGHYLNNEKNCVVKNIQNCKEYIEGPDNKCEKCNSLFFLNQDKTACTGFSEPHNCIESAGTQEKCTMCKNGYLLTNASCVSTRDTNKVDSDCIGNIEETENSKCARCGNDKVPILGTTPTRSKQYMTDNNCAQIDPANGNCSQCIEYYQMEGSTCVKAANPETLRCIQTKVGSTLPLSDNSECVKCSDDGAFFLNKDDEYCSHRESHAGVINCNKWDPEAMECLECKANMMQGEGNSVARCFDPENMGSTVMENCAVTDEDNDVCLTCNAGYYKNDSDECVAFVAEDVYDLYTYSLEMEPTESQKIDFSDANCTKAVFYNDSENGCVKCKSGTVLSLKPSTTSLFSLDNAVGEPSFISTGGKCLEEAKTAQFNNGGNPAKVTSAGTCAIGENYSDQYFTCLRCSAGKIGEIEITNLDETGSDSGSDSQSLKNCTDATGMTKHYVYMNNLSVFGKINIMPDIFFPFNKCADNKALLYMYRFNMVTGEIIFQDKKQANGDSYKQAYCVDASNFDNKTQNCAFWVLDSLVAEGGSIETLDYANTKCGACMPGYKPIFDGSGILFQGCQIISDCETSDPSKNTWINSCQTPKHGSWIELYRDNESVRNIDFSSTVPEEEKIENCYVVNHENAAKCVFCKEGFEMTEEGTCRSLINKGDSCDVLVGKANLTLSETPSSEFKNLNYNLGKMIRLLVADPKNRGVNSGECVKCNYELQSFYVIDSPKICEIKTPTPDNAIEFCEIYNFNDDSCVKCVNGKRVKNDGSECSNVEDSGCIKYSEDTPGTKVCTTCKEGFVLNDSNICVQSFCDLMVDNECLICAEGFQKATGKNICNNQNLPYSDCKHFSITDNACVKCKDEGKIPYNIRAQINDETMVISVYCVEFALSGNGFGNLHPDYPYIDLLQQGSDGSRTQTLKFLQTPDQKKRMYIKTDPASEPFDSHCVPNFELEKQCGVREGFYCTSCAEGDVLVGTGICMSFQNKGCKDLTEVITNNLSSFVCTECTDKNYYVDLQNENICVERPNFDHNDCAYTENNHSTCITCKKGKWRDQGVCKDYSNAQNCNYFNSDADECSSCLLGFYLDSGKSNTCSPSTAENCASLKMDADECLDCMKGFVKNDSKVCVREVFTNCDTIDNEKSECTKCKEGYILNQDKKTCDRRKALNCKDYQLDSDKCSVCEKGFLATNESIDCNRNKAKNCQNYDDLTDTCEFCGNLYQKDAGDANKCKMKTASYCTAFEVDKDECVNCASGWYKDSEDQNKCKLMTVENCLENIDNKNECKKCRMDYIPDAENKNVCQANTAKNCKKFNQTKHQCTECVENYWLDSNDPENILCKENTAENCKTKANDMNQCVDCAKNFWMDGADGNKCKAFTAENCETYHETKNMCDTCKANFLRKVDEKSVVTCEAYTAKNCKSYNPSKDQCAACNDGTWYKVDGNTVTCENRVNNKYCKRVNPDADSCEECENKYYLDDKNICVESTEVKNCKTYHAMKEDKCVECNEGYYKSLTKNECWLYPDGIADCAHYSARDVCVRCNSSTYLESNTCKKVTKLVSNCEEYSDAVTCKKCGIDKFLDAENNKCVDVTIQNCLELETASTCSKCLPQYLLNAETKKCESSNITDCAIPLKAADGTITCKECTALKILSEDKKTCKTPPNQVANCAEYKIDAECERCNDMYLLSIDKKTCSDINLRAGAKCKFAKELSEPICDGCRLGYKINDEGKCVELELPHCYLQNPVTKKCDLCKTNSYMNSDGKCIYEASEPDKAFESRISSLWLIAIALIYFF